MADEMGFNFNGLPPEAYQEFIPQGGKKKKKSGKVNSGSTQGVGSGVPLKGSAAPKNASMGSLSPKASPAVDDSVPIMTIGGRPVTMEQFFESRFGGRYSGSPGDMTHKSGAFKGMTTQEAYTAFMNDPSAFGWNPENQKGGSAATNLGSSGVDADGNAVNPKFDYSKYGQPQDLDPNKVNPYRDFSQGGSGFQSKTQTAGKLGAPALRNEAERRERVDSYHFFDKQDANTQHANASAAVQEAKQKQQDDREYENMKIASSGSRTSADGVTRFYSDKDRQAAAKSAEYSQQAQTMAKQGGDMETARGLAQQSMANDRSSANSSPGRATIASTSSAYTPFGSPGYGIGGVSLTDNSGSDDQTRSGVPMGLQEAKSTVNMPIQAGNAGAGAQAARKDAGARIGAAIRDTAMNEQRRTTRPDPDPAPAAAAPLAPLMFSDAASMGSPTTVAQAPTESRSPSPTTEPTASGGDALDKFKPTSTNAVGANMPLSVAPRTPQPATPLVPSAAAPVANGASPVTPRGANMPNSAGTSRVPAAANPAKPGIDFESEFKKYHGTSYNPQRGGRDERLMKQMKDIYSERGSLSPSLVYNKQYGNKSPYAKFSN